MPLNSFSFDIIKHVDKNKAIHDDLKKIYLIKGIKQKEAIKLKKLISDNLVWLPKDSFQIILSQLIADLRSNVLNVKKAVLYRIKENFGYEDISLDDIKLKVEVDDENDVHVVSNLTKFQVLDEVNVHEILGRGLLAIGGLNSRIETMRAFSALTGFKKKELQFFEDKLSFITKTIEPEEYEKRARNILSWPRFPDLSQAIFCKRLRIDKLLKIRESRDCFEFRQWLWSTDSIDDKELNEWLQSLGSKLSFSLVSKTGKTFRWLAITGLGYIPVIGKFLGPTASVLDTFLIERLLPNRGAVTFLGNVYPSIFKGE